MVSLILLINKYYTKMATQQTSLTFKEINLDLNEWKILTEPIDKNQMVLQLHNRTQRRYGYAYRVNTTLATLKQRLEKQANLYNRSISDSLAKIEDILGINIRGSTYVMVTRVFSQSMNPLSELVSSPIRKGGLKIEDIISKMVEKLRQLDAISFCHKNLSLDKIYYAHPNLVIELPLLPTLCKQLRSFGYFGEQEKIQADHFSHDVRSLLIIIVKMTSNPRQNEDIVECNSLRQKQLLERIKYAKIKTLVSQLLRIKQEGGDCSKISFKMIQNCLLNGEALPLVKKRQGDNIQIDILKLNYFKKGSVIAYYPGGEPISSFTKHLQEYQINCTSYQGSLEIVICPKHSPDFKIVTIINDCDWNQPFRKYLKNVEALLQLFIQQSGRFEVKSEGILCYFIPNERALDLQFQLNTNFLKDTSESSKFPWNLIGNIKGGSYTRGRCFLINPRIIVTSANICFDRQTKVKSQFFQCEFLGRKYICKNFRYPEQYQTCQDQSAWKYNYALAYLEGQSISREIMPTILLNYHQDQSIDQPNDQDNNNCFVFAIDSSLVDPSELIINSNQVAGIGQSLELGSPIFLRKWERWALVGINSGGGLGLLFQGPNHLETFYQYMYDLGASRQEIAQTRFCLYGSLDFGQDQVNDCFDSVDLMYADYKLSASQFFEEYPLQLCYLLEKQIKTQPLYSSKLLKYYEIILNAYQIYFYPTHCKVPGILLQIAEIHKNMARFSEAHSVLETALQFQTEGRSNPNLLAEIHFALGSIYQLTENSQYAEKQYNQSLKLCQKLHNWKLKGKILHNLGEMQQSSQKLLDYFGAALTIKQKYSNQADLFETIVSFASKVLQSSSSSLDSRIILALKQLSDKGRTRELIDRLGLSKASLKADAPGQKSQREIISKELSALCGETQFDL